MSTTASTKVPPANSDVIVDRLKKCVIYPCAKWSRQVFQISSISNVSAFDLVHMDTWSPYKIATFDGNKYFITVVDNFTLMTWVFLLKIRSDICVVLQQCLAYVKI